MLNKLLEFLSFLSIQLSRLRQGFQKAEMLGWVLKEGWKKIHEAVCIISIRESKRKSLRKAH